MLESGGFSCSSRRRDSSLGRHHEVTRSPKEG
jgi:hypothetical protein